MGCAFSKMDLTNQHIYNSKKVVARYLINCIKCNKVKRFITSRQKETACNLKRRKQIINPVERRSMYTQYTQQRQSCSKSQGDIAIEVSIIQENKTSNSISSCAQIENSLTQCSEQLLLSDFYTTVSDGSDQLKQTDNVEEYCTIGFKSINGKKDTNERSASILIVPGDLSSSEVRYTTDTDLFITNGNSNDDKSEVTKKSLYTSLENEKSHSTFLTLTEITCPDTFLSSEELIGKITSENKQKFQDLPYSSSSPYVLKIESSSTPILQTFGSSNLKIIFEKLDKLQKQNTFEMSTAKEEKNDLCDTLFSFDLNQGIKVADNSFPFEAQENTEQCKFNSEGPSYEKNSQINIVFNSIELNKKTNSSEIDRPFSCELECNDSIKTDSTVSLTMDSSTIVVNNDVFKQQQTNVDSKLPVTQIISPLETAQPHTYELECHKLVNDSSSSTSLETDLTIINTDEHSNTIMVKPSRIPSFERKQSLLLSIPERKQLSHVQFLASRFEKQFTQNRVRSSSFQNLSPKLTESITDEVLKITAFKSKDDGANSLSMKCRHKLGDRMHNRRNTTSQICDDSKLNQAPLVPKIIKCYEIEGNNLLNKFDSNSTDDLGICNSANISEKDSKNTHSPKMQNNIMLENALKNNFFKPIKPPKGVKQAQADETSNFNTESIYGDPLSSTEQNKANREQCPTEIALENELLSNSSCLTSTISSGTNYNNTLLCKNTLLVKIDDETLLDSENPKKEGRNVKVVEVEQTNESTDIGNAVSLSTDKITILSQYELEEIYPEPSELGSYDVINKLNAIIESH